MALLFAVTCHEVAHGWVAYKRGDPTAYMLGRITLNPIKHLDPFGSVIFPILLRLMGSPVVFGWAKPVPINPRNLRDYPKDEILVSIAGVATNAALALISALLLRGLITLMFTVNLGSVAFVIDPLLRLLLASVAINAILAIFNILPVPPLDGGHLAMHLAPRNVAAFLERIQPLGFLVVILLLYLGVVDFLFNLVIRPLMALALGPAA